MTETINASVIKETADTKVGLKVSANGGKVYVKELRSLFAETALQQGDEVVMVCGTLVEGMTPAEVVNIIKAVEGEVTVVVKRGGPVEATVVVASPPPGNIPAGGVWGTVKYVGPDTQRNACIACLCCGCVGCCILLCPTDEKEAYAVNGKVYDAAGDYVQPKDEKFTPKRETMKR